MSAAGPPQGANHAPSGGVGVHTSAGGRRQGAERASPARLSTADKKRPRVITARTEAVV